MIDLIAKLKGLIVVIQLLGELLRNTHHVIPRLVSFWRRVKPYLVKLFNIIKLSILKAYLYIRIVISRK